MSGFEVQVVLDSDVTECGEVLAGEVRWSPAEPTPKRVVVRLLFRTDGSASPPDVGGPDEMVIAHPSGGRARFELVVPARGPITFAGTSVSVSWQLEVRLEVPTGSDALAAVPITVLPAGGLAVWARQSAPPPRQGESGPVASES